MKRVELEEKDLKRLFKTNTPMARATRYFWRAVKAGFSFVVLFFIFFALLNFSAYYARLKFTVAPPTAAPIVETPPAPAAPAPNYSPELKIPKIGLDAPVIMNVVINDVIAKLVNGVVQLSGSAEPGQNGNVVIFGHSSDYPWSNGHYKTIFALLDKLNPGDQIAIPYGSQEFVYTVTGSKVVKPTEISVVNKTTDPTLTLITCYPVGTATNRLIITASLSSGSVTGTQADSPLTSNLSTPR